jgi:hypothetical protein
MGNILSDSDIVEKKDGNHKVFFEVLILGKKFERRKQAEDAIDEHNARVQSKKNDEEQPSPDVPISTEELDKILDEQIAEAPLQETESSPSLK